MSFQLGGKIRKIDNYYEIEFKCSSCGKFHILNNKNNEFEVKLDNVQRIGFGPLDQNVSRINIISVDTKLLCNVNNELVEVKIQDEL